MLVYHALGVGQLARAEPDLFCQLNARGEPEFGFTIRVSNMHVHSRLFARKEEEAEGANTKYRGCHAFTSGDKLSPANEAV